mgnify:CR=1 FL=1
MHRLARKRGGSKSINAATQKNSFSHNIDYVNYWPVFPYFAALAKEFTKKLDRIAALRHAHAHARDCELICKINVQLLPPHPR